MKKGISKEWIGAMKSLKSMSPEERATPRGLQMVIQCHRHAPEELKERMRPGLHALVAQFSELLPKPTHCDGEGFMVHTTEELASVTGLAIEDMQFLLDEVARAYPDDIVKEVHRMQ
ncbi:hypothetical protein [Geotalea toluenoxydans]|uniref:hypothetical protein n=1 Tax=Geotalea toluenoxydans TaxID=421624 RepID=UPI0006CFBC5E|nr:hypothetical protein [Geotalea toluenoxydans]